MKGLFFFSLFILVPTLSHGAPAASTTDYQAPEISAVEKKKYSPQKDLSAKLGVLPLDAFYKAVSLGVAYTKNFESYWGWEIINADVAFTQDTGLKKDLLQNYSVKPQGILEYPKYTVSTNFVYTPMYTKNLLRNIDVVHSEVSLVGGGGMVAFNSGDTAPMVGGGFIMRYYSSQKLSYKFDTRLYYTTATGKSSNFLLNIGFALAFEFGEPNTAHGAL